MASTPAWLSDSHTQLDMSKKKLAAFTADVARLEATAAAALPTIASGAGVGVVAATPPLPPTASDVARAGALVVGGPPAAAPGAGAAATAGVADAATSEATGAAPPTSLRRTPRPTVDTTTAAPAPPRPPSTSPAPTPTPSPPAAGAGGAVQPPPVPATSIATLPAWLLDSKAQLASFNANLQATQSRLSQLTTALADFDAHVSPTATPAAAAAATPPAAGLAALPASVFCDMMTFLTVHDAVHLAASTSYVRDVVLSDDTWRLKATTRWHLQAPTWGWRLDCWYREAALRAAVADMKAMTMTSTNSAKRSDLHDSLTNLTLLSSHVDDVVTRRELLAIDGVRALAFCVKDESPALQELACACLGNLVCGESGSAVLARMRALGTARSFRALLASPDAPSQPMPSKHAARALANVQAPHTPIACSVGGSMRFVSAVRGAQTPSPPPKAKSSSTPSALWDGPRSFTCSTFFGGGTLRNRQRFTLAVLPDGTVAGHGLDLAAASAPTFRVYGMVRKSTWKTSPLDITMQLWRREAGPPSAMPAVGPSAGAVESYLLYSTSVPPTFWGVWEVTGSVSHTKLAVGGVLRMEPEDSV